MPAEPHMQEGSGAQILVYGIVMRGMVAFKDSHTRVHEVAARQGIVFGGIPVKRGATDAMQLVMQRALWLAEGGWYDRSKASDGLMYQEFVMKYRVLAVPAVLGEHW